MLAILGNIRQARSVREIITDWQAVGTPGGMTVMYFNESSSVDDQRNALSAFYQGIDNLLYTATSWVIRPSGRLINEVDGALTGTWSSGLPENGAGAASTGPVSNSSQILFQWITGAVRRRRLVRGRSFIPGLDQSNMTEGRLTQGAQASLGLNGTALVQAGVGLGVWSRPITGSIGSLAPVTGATVWSELAVQRGRRN